jgi:hypothetical protein
LIYHALADIDEKPLVNTAQEPPVAELLVRPRISQHPQNAVVSAGGTAVLYCTADGNPIPELIWRFNGYVCFWYLVQSMNILGNVQVNHILL